MEKLLHSIYIAVTTFLTNLISIYFDKMHYIFLSSTFMAEKDPLSKTKSNFSKIFVLNKYNPAFYSSCNCCQHQGPLGSIMDRVSVIWSHEVPIPSDPPWIHSDPLGSTIMDPARTFCLILPHVDPLRIHVLPPGLQLQEELKSKND